MGLWDFLLDRRWEQLDHLLEQSFAKVRRDTYNISQWLKYLRQKDLRNDQHRQKVAVKLDSHDEQIRQLKTEIEMLKISLEGVKNQPKISPFPDQFRTRSGPKSEPKASETFSHKIIAQMRPVKKEYVLQQILNLVEKESYTTKQIETIVVREKTLCGRTAFYDYLRELKHRGMVVESASGSRRVLAVKHRR